MNILCLHKLAAVAAIIMPLISAQADTWLYPAEVKTHEYTFGDVRAVVTEDATKDQHYPTFLLTVFKEGAEVARYPGVAFETLVASPDNRVFVGLSNSGLPGTAVVVFNDRGDVTLLASHHLAEFDYCTKSITLERVWYNRDEPDVEFKLEGKAEDQGIYLQSCRGARIELLHTVVEAYARKLELLK